MADMQQELVEQALALAKKLAHEVYSIPEVSLANKITAAGVVTNGFIFAFSRLDPQVEGFTEITVFVSKSLIHLKVLKGIVNGADIDNPAYHLKTYVVHGDSFV